MKKILSPEYSLKLKNIILLLKWGLILSYGHIRNVVSTLPNVVKIDVENDNVASTLSNVAQFNIEIHNVASTLIWRCATQHCTFSNSCVDNFLWIFRKLQINYFSETSLDTYFKLTSDISLKSTRLKNQ